MNEQLAEVLEWLKTRVDGTEQFILEQAPLYVQEVLAWEFFTSITATALWLCISGILLLSSRQSFLQVARESKPDDKGLFAFIGFLLLAFGAMTLIIGAGINACSAVKVKIAPRVIIVEHLRHQAGG